VPHGEAAPDFATLNPGYGTGYVEGFMRRDIAQAIRPPLFRGLAHRNALLDIELQDVVEAVERAA
jgi:hypothetical protein